MGRVRRGRDLGLSRGHSGHEPGLGHRGDGRVGGRPGEGLAGDRVALGVPCGRGELNRLARGERGLGRLHDDRYHRGRWRLNVTPVPATGDREAGGGRENQDAELTDGVGHEHRRGTREGQADLVNQHGRQT